MNLVEAVFLGIVQALTEWLPISSSGHLVLIQQLLGLNPPLIFDAMLHLGTLIVVILIFPKDILRILKCFARLDFKSEYGRLGLFLIIGTIPAGVLGLGFRGFFESLFYSLSAVAIAFVVTGFILFFTRRGKGDRKLNFWDSIFVGIAQGVAIAPGISRSGLTIGVGLMRGVKREMAVKYSFLLSIPAILGALVVEIADLVWEIELTTMLLGMVVSMVVGFLSFKLLLNIINRGKLHQFSYYCWAIGIVTLIIRIV